MVYIILGQGFEEIEAVAPGDILRRGNVKVCYAAVGDCKTVAGAHGIKIEADAKLSDITPSKDDYLLVPGGMGGVNSIKADKSAMALIKSAAESGTRLAAICAGPSVLASLGLLREKRITCYPGCENLMADAVTDISKPVLSDGTLLTGRAPGSAIEFGLALLEIIAGEAAAKDVQAGMVC